MVKERSNLAYIQLNIVLWGSLVLPSTPVSVAREVRDSVCSTSFQTVRLAISGPMAFRKKLKHEAAVGGRSWDVRLAVSLAWRGLPDWM